MLQKLNKHFEINQSHDWHTLDLELKIPRRTFREQYLLITICYEDLIQCKQLSWKLTQINPFLFYLRMYWNLCSKKWFKKIGWQADFTRTVSLYWVKPLVFLLLLWFHEIINCFGQKFKWPTILFLLTQKLEIFVSDGVDTTVSAFAVCQWVKLL